VLTREINREVTLEYFFCDINSYSPKFRLNRSSVTIKKEEGPIQEEGLVNFRASGNIVLMFSCLRESVFRVSCY